MTPRRRRALQQLSCGERAAAVDLSTNLKHTMDKAQERHDAPESAEVRKLNMEEKRKLEKLLIADIDSAVARYDAVTQEERNALIEKLERSPSAEVKKLFERYKDAVKQQKEIESELKAVGYDVDYGGELDVNTSGTKAKQLAEFDDRADEMRCSLTTLKRNYVIKLFADHADTQSLFVLLAKDLERLIG
jgi:hypothetical protein